MVVKSIGVPWPRVISRILGRLYGETASSIGVGDGDGGEQGEHMPPPNSGEKIFRANMV